MHRARVFTGVLASLWVALFIVACQEEPSPAGLGSEGGLTPAAKPTYELIEPNEATDAALVAMLDQVNADLEAQGANYRAWSAEYITVGSEDAGNTVIANNRGNKQLSFDFIPGDPRRAGWSGGPFDNITYAIDTTGDADAPGPATAAGTDAAIVSAMTTWDNVDCSNMPINRNPDFGIDIGIVAFCVSGGAIGSPFVFGDVQHSGWLDLEFGGNTIGVAFTFGFVFDPPVCPGNAPFTDHDGDGRCDAAFREIYYDPVTPAGPLRSWATDGVNDLDVETVALHEAGHGLSQGHFGKVFVDNNGNLKFAPKAVMNAVYVGPFSVLGGTDNGGHCSDWANWPNG